MSRHLAARVVRWAGLVCLCAAIAAPGAGSGQGPVVPRPRAGDQALSARPAAALEAGKGEAALPPGTSQDWWSKVQEDIQQQEYSVTWSDQTPLPGVKGAWQAPNRAQGFRTYFTKEGIRLVPRTEEKPSWAWGLKLARWGREGAWQDATAAEPRAEANRVTLDRKGIQEWYVNDERGLEQGFTIPSPPAVADTLSPHSSLLTPHYLSIDLALSGTLRPAISEDGQAVDFYGEGSFNVLRYAQLKVTDTAGRVLPARFEGVSSLRTPHPSLLAAAAGGIRISIDDAGASYPITVDPLTTTPQVLEANQDGAQFGTSVATAGDVNGDGYSDVIVGTPFYDGGQADEGRAFVYLGSSSGLVSAAPWTAESDQAYAQFGVSAATAGDVNGDGYSDVIVGAPSYDGAYTNAGRVFVYYGSASGLSGTPWTADCDQANAGFGQCVATAGDVNGDGYSDVIIGANNYDNGQPDEGRAYVYHGSASGLGTSAAWTAESDQASAFFGWSVSTAGDVNGDGYADVIVGCHAYDNGQNDEGRVFVWLGSLTGLGANGNPGNANWSAESNQANAYFGLPVATAGDVNGDGYSDVLVAAQYFDNDQVNEGRVFLYLGSSTGLGTSAAWTAESNQVNGYFGQSVGTAGDVNGDGYADVIIGAAYYDHGNTDEGAAFVYLGSSSSTGLGASAIWTAEGNQDTALFGLSVATAGDVNGDGYSDVIVGAPYYDNPQTDEGAAFVYTGSASGLGATALVLEYNQAYAEFGYSVATAGDVNGDGYSDVIIGAPLYDNGQTDEGRAFVYLGSASGLGSAAAWTAGSAQAGAQFGVSVATAGDVNGDGCSDVIVGASLYDNGQTDEGAAYIYYGAASGLGTTPLRLEVNHAGAQFGWSVSTAGDVNGDGYSDVIVGVLSYSNGLAAGVAFVYYGTSSGLNTTPLMLEMDVSGGSWYHGVAAAGDVNGDGYSDVIVGDPHYSNAPMQYNEGAAFIYYGSSSGLNTTPLRLERNQEDAQFGSSVAAAGDVNGDGYSDVIVGAPYYNNGQYYEGVAFVYYGAASGLNTTPLLLEANQANAQFGYCVATAGDVNGDGYSDVIVGAPYYDNGQTDEGTVFLYTGSASGLNTTPVVLEANQAGAFFGASVAAGGDVNGDGYSDIIVGAYAYDNGQTDEGAAFLYYGGGGSGLSLVPQQRRADDAAPIAHLGKSDSAHSFEAALKGRTPYGRGKFKLEWEAKPLGTPFDGTGTGRTAAWQDTGVTGLLQKEAVGGLTVETVYHWRARLLYRPATVPFQQVSRWLTLPYNGPQEADLRTAFGSSDLGVTQSDIDPTLLGGNCTYAATVGNAGPDRAIAVLADTIPAGSAFVSATPSQGSCWQFGGAVACGFGFIESGATATVSVVVTPPSLGSFTNHSSVSTPSQDGNPSNDACDETTTVIAPAIGNRVWGDVDGDGIQDAGETGLAGVVVQLYDSTYTWLAQKVTNGSGFYQFTGLTYGSSYFVKVIPPSVSYVFSQPNQGGDDTLDSDVDVSTGQTPIFSLVDGRDPARWDAGLVYGITCDPPDEACWIYQMTLSVPDDYPIIHWQDWNQLGQRTGWNVRRSNDRMPPKETWPVVASNILDGDAGTPNMQWTDISGDDPGPGGVWYYQVTAYNAYCPAEGPF